MARTLSILLAVCAAAVTAVGAWLSNAQIRCRGQPMKPGETCMFGGGPRTYESLAAEPFRQFSYYLAVAGVMVVVALGCALLARRGSNLPRAGVSWPSTRWSTLLGLGVAAIATYPVGRYAASRPVTCGGERMRPADQCVNYQTGNQAGYQEVAAAPIQQLWFYLLIGSLLAAVAVVLVIRRRGPTEVELRNYTARMARIRAELLAAAGAGPQDQPPRTVQRFDRQLAAELERARSMRRPRPDR